MTSSICASITTGTEGTLIDTRDNTTYYVGKMLDGNCWMLQNLALGTASSSTTLTSTSSNVSSSWTLPASYTSATSGTDGASGNSVIQSWNFGKWVLATPELTGNCGDSGSIPSLSSCTKVGFVDVSNTTNFKATYTATTRSWDGANATSSTLVAVNCTAWSGSGTSKTCTAGTYDAHYLVGNYYSWYTATAGGAVASNQASNSICPKGWKLPTSNTTAVGSFAGLLSKYGVNSKLSGTVDEVTYNIAGPPLRFVRGGRAHPGNYISFAGQTGACWSSTPQSSYNAYRLVFDNSNVTPSGVNVTRYGYPVRCIAQ